MISGLLLLNSASIGSRDLWWVDDPLAKKGYNVYRSYDNAFNWVKINIDPTPGHFYRDQSQLQIITLTLTDDNWVEKGEMGKFVIKLPDIPYSDVVQGRPTVATSPDDVTVIVDNVSYRAAMVSGMDQTITLPVDNNLPLGGAVSNFKTVPTAGIVSGTSVVKVVYKKLLNFVDIYTSLTRTFYTVVGINDDGFEIHQPGALGTQIVDTLQIDKMDYIQAEMVRRNSWLIEQVAEPAWLMFRRTRGDACGCTRSGLGQARTACPSCFETGIIGGYYGPFDIPYVDPDSAATRELDEGGIKVTRESRSYLGPTPIVQDGDLVIRRNGERLVISGVTYKSPRGVILMQEFSTTLLTKGDTRYLIPVTPTTNIFNPATQEDPGQGEPVFVAENNPEEKVWENEDPQAGRTITFGNIQT